MAVNWATRFEFSTVYSADSVEWCPVDQFQDFLVCGTYQLEQQENEQTQQKRVGRIYLFKVADDFDNLRPIFKQDLDCGILDQKWSYHLFEDHPILATVTSTGDLKLYKLKTKEESPKLEQLLNEEVNKNALSLSLDWSSNKYQNETDIVVSDSSGSLSVYKLDGTRVEKVGVWKGHNYEAWIAAFNYWTPNVFYSGGDDCMFKTYDIRAPDAVNTNKTHQAGVTAIRSDVLVEHRILTGSYDEHVKLWDARNLSTCITDKDVNGGIWRLKWHPYRKGAILAACMYGGFRTLLIENNNISITSEYMDHESIAYGADWKFESGCDKSYAATCSFYDCLMNISEVTFPSVVDDEVTYTEL